MKFLTASVIVLVALAPLELRAQGRAPQRPKPDTTIPRSAIPPAGMCRIWLDDVPVAQQPAPTDCATAVRNRPAKGRVIFGDDYVKTRRGDSTRKQLPIKGFAPAPKPKPKPPRP